VGVDPDGQFASGLDLLLDALAARLPPPDPA